MPPREEAVAFSHAITLLVAVAGAGGALALALTTSDPVMTFHGLLFFVFFAAGGYYVATHPRPGGKDEQDSYMDGPIKVAVVAAVLWGVVGFLVGDIIAWQLAFPALNLDLPWTNFGRLRPVHTSAVIFAFGGNVLLATSFYVVQRTCRARIAGYWAPWFVIWGYQLFIVLAASGYVLGVTEGKEYAEPEWYVDLWLTLVWVVYLLIFLGTLWKRSEPHIYVANWFFLAFIVTIAMLHVVNNLAVPVSFLGTKSYSAILGRAGCHDAMVVRPQRGGLLPHRRLPRHHVLLHPEAGRTAGLFLPAVDRALLVADLPLHLGGAASPPLHRAARVGADARHDLLDHAVDALVGRHDQRSDDAFGRLGPAAHRPVVRLLVVSVAFYGMSTFEGPLMSIKSVNSLSHYTDWTIGHVHSGALGWVGMVSFGAIYCLVPWLWKRRGLYSIRLVEWHFWVATIGLVLYVSAMWVSGITQGLMWRAYDNLGFLKYSFVETVEAMHWPYVIRATGGVAVPPGRYSHGHQRLAHDPRRRVGDLAEQPASAAAAELRARCRGSAGGMRGRS